MSIYGPLKNYLLSKLGIDSVRSDVLNDSLESVIRKIEGLDIPIPVVSSPSQLCWAMSE